MKLARVTETGEVPRPARRDDGEYRGIFDRGPTSTGGMHRRSNAAGVSPRLLGTQCTGQHLRSRAGQSVSAPQHVRLEKRRPCVGDTGRRSDDDSGRREIDRGDVVGKNLLHLVKQPLPLHGVGSCHLRGHQRVDARFPRGGGSGLTGIPEVECGATQPEIEIRSRIGITCAEP